MRALAIVGQQRLETCRWCGRCAVEVELKWATSDGSRGTSWRMEKHDCKEVTLSSLVAREGEEVFGDSGHV